ncbi:hypothetical protein ITJ38_04480 [Agreia pratensis]|uniref:FMN-binding domain-containing protein n=1 Tax=Agreia pratensis TaxID=150121 RepID=A0A1X7HZC8_9MICO|nr:FMN-binding protein [Agreia pratensis]MBF4633657.1 hypothetical protein [Agreia pratensis]SMG07187.1 hypothetical protein SAMN06296010_0022 [Agreia pratensis]
MITRHQKTAVTALAGLSLLGVVTGCSTGAGSSDSGSTPGASLESTSDAAPSTSAPAGSSAYKDGEYKAEGEYTSPGGKETVGVSLTLAGDKVTAVTVTPESTNPNGKKYQGEFADGIAAEVVGKSLNDLKVSKVAGSSLTSGGFNDAVDKIKADAGV